MIATDHNRRRGQAEGERRKAAALDLLEARREVYVLRGRRALLQRLLMEGTGTADDVKVALDLPADLDPRCLGAVPGLLAKAGIIRRAGFAKSDRPERHASYIIVWELADRNAALRWMAAHPDLPDPPAPAEAEGTLFDLDTNTKPAGAAAGFVLRKGFSL